MGLISAAFRGTPGRQAYNRYSRAIRQGFSARLARPNARRTRSHHRGPSREQARSQNADQNHDCARDEEGQYGAEMNKPEAVEHRADRLTREEEEGVQRHGGA